MTDRQTNVTFVYCIANKNNTRTEVDNSNMGGRHRDDDERRNELGDEPCNNFSVCVFDKAEKETG